MKEDLISLEKRKTGELILRVKSGKRRKLYFKILKTITGYSTCDSIYCPIYFESSRMKSPYRKSVYANFCEFCNNLGYEFPQILDIVKNITHIVPDERYRNRVGK